MNTTLFTDASHCPTTKAGGCAAWIKSNDGTQRHSGNFKRRACNSYEAELMAVVNGVYLAYRAFPCTSYLCVATDCKSIIDKLERGAGSASTVLEKEIFNYLLNVPFKLRLKHVKAHRGGEDKRSSVNEWCDRSARAEMKKQRKMG